MHKAGFVNIVGNPNVGKSTLMNLLVGERISIATFKSQTTRHRIMGILNTDDMQIVFSDTPGVVKPNYKLQESMLNFSESALVDADILLYVTDVVEKTDKNAATMMFPLVASTSQATLEFSSSFRHASRILSAIRSQSLSGCPSVTDSAV